MSTEISNDEKQENQKVFIVNSIEATVRIGLIVLVTYLCLDIIRPFFVPILWGLIIATSLYPIQKWLTAKLGNRDRISAFLITFTSLGLLISMSIGFSSALISSSNFLIFSKSVVLLSSSATVKPVRFAMYLNILSSAQSLNGPSEPTA